MKWLEKEKELPKKDVDYELIDIRSENEYILRTSIKILTGKYKNIVYHYGKVAVDEDKNPPSLKYQYVITDEQKFDVKKLHSDKKFTELMGDILYQIVTNDMNLENYIKEHDDQIRINNTQEPDL